MTGLVRIEDDAQARAYLAGIAYGHSIPLNAWRGWGDGTATAPHPDGGQLIFTGHRDGHRFDFAVPCVCGTHREGVTTRQDVTRIAETVAAHTAKPDLPRRAPGAALPLWRRPAPPGALRPRPDGASPFATVVAASRAARRHTA